MSSKAGEQYRVTKRIANNGNLDIRVFGFKPRKVTVQNLTNNYKLEWNEGLAEAAGIVTSDAGARSVVSADGVSLLDGDSSNPPGFRLGALANINDTTTEDLLIEAVGGQVVQA